MLLIEVVIDNCVDQPMGDGGKDETNRWGKALESEVGQRHG